MSTVNQIVGGAFQDADGNLLANGYLTFELSADGVANTSTLVCSGLIIQILLDMFGDVVTTTAQNLYPNDGLTPSGTFYIVTAYTATGERVWGPNCQSILSTPSPFNISAWIPGKV
jgi:hypothetical protein